MNGTGGVLGWVWESRLCTNATLKPVCEGKSWICFEGEEETGHRCKRGSDHLALSNCSEVAWGCGPLVCTVEMSFLCRVQRMKKV